MIFKYLSHIISATAFMCVASVIPSMAYALHYDIGPVGLKLTGYGTAGILEPDFKTPDFIGDWRVRGEIDWRITDINSFGAVYAIDAAAVDEDKYMREGFVYWQNRHYGRAEFGFTDSIARKLGVGLPDVGGLRVNDKPLFYKKIHPNGPVISDTTLTTGRSALRLNLATMPIGAAQYGLSVSGITDNYDYAIDAAIKIRRPSGKVEQRRTATALKIFRFQAKLLN